MIWIFWFIAGTFAGSVANALVYRLPRNKSWVSGRSICPSCHHELGILDLIPLLSFVFLGGKCRYCRKSIGMSYFWVELIMAISFAYLQNVFLAGLAFVSITVAVTDWKTQLISEWMLILGTIFVIFINFSVPGAIIGAAVIGLIWALSRGRAMGFGDVEIAAVMGLALGWPKILVGLWLAFVLGGLIGLIGLIGHMSKLKDKIAFGPFLIVGGWLAAIWGTKIWSWFF